MSTTGATSNFLTPMRRVLFVTGVGFAALLPIGTAVGWMAGGSDVGLGILLGLAMPAVFFGLTVVAGVFAARLGNSAFVGVVMASWLVKVVALLAVMAVLKDAEFFHRTAFLIAFVIGIAGWLAAEMMVVQRTRVPYVDVSGGA